MYVKDRRMELTLGCDANSHHEVWGSTNTNSRGESLLRLQMGTELHILTRGTEPTFPGSREQEVTDIIICTQGVMNMVRDWAVSSKPSGSNNREIHCAFHQITLKEKWGHNPRQTDWMGYTADLQSQLKKKSQPLSHDGIESYLNSSLGSENNLIMLGKEE
jgi:hypothetical protein